MALEIDQRASYSAGYIVWSDRQHAIKRRRHFLIPAQRLVGKSDLLEHGKISRIELQRLRNILERFLPPTFTSINVGGQKWNPRFVRQRQTSEHQLLPRSAIIPMRIVVMLTESQMGISRFRPEPLDRMNCCLRQLQTRICMV